MRPSTRGQQHADGSERVVRKPPGPDELPQSRDQSCVVDAPDRRGQGPEEQRLAAVEGGQHGLLQRIGQRLVGGQRQEEFGEVGRSQSQPAVLAGQVAGAAPDHLTCAGELVEHRRCVARHPRRQYQRLHGRGRQDGTGQLLDHGEHRVRATRRRPDLLPHRQEPRQRLRRNRLHLLAQPGQRPAAQPAQHLGLTPLDPTATRPELPADHPSGGRQPLQRGGDHRDAQAQAGGAVLDGERAVRAREPAHEVTERVGDRLRERLRDTDRQGGTEGVPHPAGILHGDPTQLPGDPHLQQPPAPLQFRQPLLGGAALDGLHSGQITEQPEQVHSGLDILGPALRRTALEFVLDLGQCLGVQQLAQLRPAEQLGQYGGVQRQGLGAPLGQRGVTLVQECADVAEQQ